MQTVSTIGIIKYDGLGRRNYKEIINCADWNRTYKYYYDGHKLVELRQGDGKVLKQYVWGTQYTDELVQIGTNPSTGSGP